MAIYKGQLMNQETKDILYPQTSTDMVDGLEELLEQAVIDNMTPPINKLVNGDFQINQRGQTNYSSNSSTRSYGLDYWCSQIENGQTLTVYPAGENGVRLVGNSVSGQYFQEIEHIENGENHIVSTVIEIRSGTGKISLVVFDGVSFKTKKLVNGYNEFDLGNSNIHRVGLIFNGTFDIFCNFIRLDEGNIAYQHQKEDKAIALIRCEGKTQLYKMISCPRHYSKFYTGFPFRRKMDSVPTIANLNLSTVNGVDITNDAKISVNEYGIDSINLVSQDATAIVFKNVIFTCEPL